MASPRFRHLATITSVALLSLALIVPAPAGAAQAGWQFLNGATRAVGTAELLPATVTPGAAAGYHFFIKNNGSSNVAALYLSATYIQPTVYVSSTRPGCLDAGVPLNCDFGALNAGDEIELTIAYNTPTSGASLSFDFEINSTGTTTSDRGKNSHGDTLKLPVSTTLSSSKDFAGGFSVLNTGSYSVQTGTNLGRNNIQSTGAQVSADHIPVTVQDGSGFSTPTCTSCGTLFGEWSSVNVNNGDPTAIIVTITVYSKSVPSKLDLSTLVVWHATSVDDTTPQRLTSSTDCSAVGCITGASFDPSKNLVIVVSLPRNGYIRGGF